jgi:ubiquitin C-terminal hydrolase
MELNLKDYIDTESYIPEDNGSIEEDCQYELKSIVIHRGGPYGGHYHAYIKDDYKQGNFYLEIPKEFSSDPTE